MPLVGTESIYQERWRRESQERTRCDWRMGQRRWGFECMIPFTNVPYYAFFTFSLWRVKGLWVFIWSDATLGTDSLEQIHFIVNLPKEPANYCNNSTPISWDDRITVGKCRSWINYPPLPFCFSIDIDTGISRFGSSYDDRNNGLSEIKTYSLEYQDEAMRKRFVGLLEGPLITSAQTYPLFPMFLGGLLNRLSILSLSIKLLRLSIKESFE